MATTNAGSSGKTGLARRKRKILRERVRSLVRRAVGVSASASSSTPKYPHPRQEEDETRSDASQSIPRRGHQGTRHRARGSAALGHVRRSHIAMLIYLDSS